jgi:hypothetical protein
MASHAQEETVKMMNTIRFEYDHLLTPPFLVKNAQSIRESSIRPSTILDRVST